MAHISSFLWSEGERATKNKVNNKVETFLQLILPVILYWDFCFACLMQKLDAEPWCHYETQYVGKEIIRSDYFGIGLDNLGKTKYCDIFEGIRRYQYL